MRFHLKRICFVYICVFVIMLTFYIVLHLQNVIRRDSGSTATNHLTIENAYGINNVDRKYQEKKRSSSTIHEENWDSPVDMKEKGNKTSSYICNVENRELQSRTLYTYNIDKYKTLERAKSKHLPSSESCNVKFPEDLKTEGTWQHVDNIKSMYVFSAYYVKARKGVFIIGVKPRKPVKVICQLWAWNIDTGSFDSHKTVGQVRAPNEGYGQKYTSTIFMCPMLQSEMPTYISLVTNFCEEPLNVLRIKNASQTGQYKRRFTVCLSPLNFQYGRAYELIEWIEFNKILGAEKFIVYNYSSANNVKEVLEHYSKSGLTEVIQWMLPMGVNTLPKTKNPVEINYFGQTAALNDCLFRNKQFSEYVVNIDLDEFIVPHSENAGNWYETIKQMENASVYIFQNTFFRKDWDKIRIPFPRKKLAEKLRLVTLQVFQHEAKIFPARQRSKYIARTADVYLILTHEVPKAKSVTVPVETCLLHHYRDWENPDDNKEKVTDVIVLEKFEHSLTENVEYVWKELAHVKMDTPIT